MLIYYNGHAEFLVETAQGQRILFDPFPAQVGFPMRRVKADVVVISHHHFDHNHVDKVDGKFITVDSPGVHEPLPGVRLVGTPAFHDPEGGSLRGEILCFTLQAEGLKVTHLGDLGQLPDEALRQALFLPDVLLIPVGGTYTLDARQARQAVDILQPRITVPMHYRSEQGGFEQIDTLAPFLAAMQPLHPSTQPLLRVTAQDLSQQPRLVELTLR